MAVTVPVNKDYDPVYETDVQLTPLVGRVLAHNPSPFTFFGTGTYIVGTGKLAVIDPGPLDEQHLKGLLTAINGREVTHILVTHTHADHSPLTKALKEKTGAKSYGFGPHGSGHANDGVKVEEGGDMEFVPDIRVKDGDVLNGEGWTFDCVFTPGHTSNHMCFALQEEKALFTGDHVMGWSTTVVGMPDGDMRAYMASLDRLTTRDDLIFYPTHGAPVGGSNDSKHRNPQDYARSLLAHRHDRESQILECLRSGISRIPAMVELMYKDVDRKLHPAAANSVFSHLVAMVQDGRVTASHNPPLPADDFGIAN